MEFVFVCSIRARNLWHRSSAPSETTPLLSRVNALQNHVENGNHANSDIVVEHRAVDVRALDSLSLKDGVMIHSLPTRMVQVPEGDSSHVAVLSWRWDFLHSALTDPSINIAQAIKYAKSRDIHFLFVDIISLDQNLSAEDLIPRVAHFGRLYESIPVIAAYDDPRLDFRYTMLRPWICSEIKRMFNNPHKIVYVGHCRQGTHITRSVLHWWLGYVPQSRMADTSFTEQLRRVWVPGFITPVLELLNGHNSMANIHDFKYIVPSMAQIFIAAEKLPSNDYLLTVALMLTPSQNYGRVGDYTIEGRFLALDYTKFMITSVVTDKERNITDRDGHTVKHIEHNELHEIYAGEEKIATLTCHHTHWKKTFTPTYTLTVVPDMHRCILEMLGLTIDTYAHCDLRESAKWTSFSGEEPIQTLNLEVIEQ